MSDEKQQAAESKIGAILLTEWDPLELRAEPDHAKDYLPYAHEVYGLLMRGGSDVQVGRLLHQIEREQMHHPEADSRDLTQVLRTLRAFEKTI